jgi:hypothetical protein
VHTRIAAELEVITATSNLHHSIHSCGSFFLNLAAPDSGAKPSNVTTHEVRLPQPEIFQIRARDIIGTERNRDGVSLRVLVTGSVRPIHPEHWNAYLVFVLLPMNWAMMPVTSGPTCC